MPNPTLVIEFDPATGGFSEKITGQIPVMPLIGMLEILKAKLIGQQMAAVMQQQARDMARGRRILMPDGSPAPIQ